MMRREFEELRAQIQEMMAQFSNDAAGNMARAKILSEMLLAEMILSLTESLRRKNGQDDNNLLDDVAAQLGSEAESLLGVDGRDAGKTLVDFRPPPAPKSSEDTL